MKPLHVTSVDSTESIKAKLTLTQLYVEIKLNERCLMASAAESSWNEQLKSLVDFM